MLGQTLIRDEARAERPYTIAGGFIPPMAGKKPKEKLERILLFNPTNGLEAELKERYGRPPESLTVDTVKSRAELFDRLKKGSYDLLVIEVTPKTHVEGHTLATLITSSEIPSLMQISMPKYRVIVYGPTAVGENSARSESMLYTLINRN